MCSVFTDKLSSSVDDIDVRSIVNELLNCSEIENISNTDDLVQFGLDSLNSIKLIVLLENIYNIEVPDEMLGKENVCTLEKIKSLVSRLTEGDIDE